MAREGEWSARPEKESKNRRGNFEARHMSGLRDVEDGGVSVGYEPANVEPDHVPDAHQRVAHERDSAAARRRREEADAGLLRGEGVSEAGERRPERGRGDLPKEGEAVKPDPEVRVDCGENIVRDLVAANDDDDQSSSPSTCLSGLSAILTVDVDIGTSVASASSMAAVACPSSENLPSAASRDERNGIASRCSQTRVRKCTFVSLRSLSAKKVRLGSSPSKVRATATMEICARGEVA